VLGYGWSERRYKHSIAYRTRGNRKCNILHGAARPAQWVAAEPQPYNRVWAASWGLEWRMDMTSVLTDKSEVRR
jgi:hypothetical protein